MINSSSNLYGPHKVVSQQWLPGQNKYSYSTFTYNGVYDTRTFSFTGFGANDPKYKRRPTGGSYTIQLVKRVQGSWWAANNGPGKPLDYSTGYMEGGESSLMWGSEYAPSHDSAVYNKAVTKLYDKLKDSDLNLAVSVGEYRETSRMISQALRSMGRVTSLAREARRQVLHNPSLLISKVWLGMKYGWLPLYNDVYNLLNYSSRKFVSNDFTARSSKVTNVYRKRTLSGLQRYSYLKGTTFSKCEVGVTAKPSNTTAFEISRITSLNPLSIAWELVPFSFVVDWFFDVGGYLSAQENACGMGLIFERGYTTRTSGHKLEDTWVQSFTQSSVPTSGGAVGKGMSYRVQKDRSTALDFPRPYFPTLKLDLGSQRIMSAASLFRTTLLGGIRH